MTESIALVPCVLLVESNDKHVLLVQAVFKELNRTVLLCCVTDVDQALRFLYKRDKYKLAPEPSLLLLNKEMPLRSGYHVLDAIYADASLTHIPVVVFSIADAFRDKANSLSRGAFAHMMKPCDHQGYKEVLREIVKMLPQKHMAAARSAVASASS